MLQAVIVYCFGGAIGLLCLYIGYKRDKYNQKWTVSGKIFTGLFAFILWFLFIPAMVKAYEDQIEKIRGEKYK